MYVFSDVDTDISKTFFKLDEGYKEDEKPEKISKNATTVISLVRSHTVPTLLHCIVQLDNATWTLSPFIPRRPTPASKHNSTAAPLQSLWVDALQNMVGVAGLSRLKQNPQVPRDYKENVGLKDLFIYLHEYLLTKVLEGQSETSY